jgi:dTDP-glucose pyrophosphorylase
VVGLKKTIKAKNMSEHINILIPMAGKGSRFAAAGFTDPKPIIDVRGRPMIDWVIKNISPKKYTATWIFVVQKTHEKKFSICGKIEKMVPKGHKAEFCLIDGITEGSACTCLEARNKIDNDDSLIIANSDQFVEWGSEEGADGFIEAGKKSDGCILTFMDCDKGSTKWSYVKKDNQCNVLEVKEKEHISDEATVGIYMWSKGSDFCSGTDKMIRANKRVKGEFYTCPVYEENICDGKTVKCVICKKMWGLGTPEDLEYFLDNHASGQVHTSEQMV